MRRLSAVIGRARGVSFRRPAAEYPRLSSASPWAYFTAVSEPRRPGKLMLIGYLAQTLRLVNNQVERPHDDAHTARRAHTPPSARRVRALYPSRSAPTRVRPQIPSTNRKPSSTRLKQIPAIVRTLRVSRPRSTVMSCETFTTEGLGSPDSALLIRTFPGASASARFDVTIATITVEMRLSLNGFD